MIAQPQTAQPQTAQPQATQPQTTAHKLTITWEHLPSNFVLPDDPVENIHQPFLAAALTDALGAAGYIQPDMLIASNFGLVATVNGKVTVRAPDWLYVPYAKPVAQGVVRRSYTPFLEGDGVAIVMEFLSDEDGGELSVRSTPPYGKLYFYEHILRVPTYATYDPYTVTLEVRCLENGQYVLQTPNKDGRYWIPELSLFLGVWHGERLSQTTNWLRWWDEAGNLLLWSSEQTARERQRAEQESQRAEQESQRAEQESQRAEQERQRADALAAKLMEMGIDPSTLGS